MDVKTAAAAAIVLVGVWEVAKAYRTQAPSLSDLRESDRDNTASRQQLLDADFTVGGIAFLGAATIGFASKSWAPSMVIVLSFLWMSLYYHLVQKGLTSEQLTG